MKIFIGLLTCVALSLPALADEMSGVFMVVKGDVKVTSKDGKTDSAKVGKKVFSGDSVIAGPDSRAKIVMSDKNILNISPDSKIIIEAYSADSKADIRNVELKVEYGKVRATVEQKYDGEKSKFNIKTPTAVAGVRGTDFLTGFNKQTKQSSIVTFSGTVAVGLPGPKGEIQNPVFVRPGQQTTVGDGKAPEAPRAMPKEDLQKMNNDSAADTAKSEPRKDNATQSAQQDDKKEEPKSEEARRDEPKKDDVKQEEPRKEEARRDEPKKDDVKKDEARREEPKPQEPGKQDQPKREEPKQAEQSPPSQQQQPQPQQQQPAPPAQGTVQNGAPQPPPMAGPAPEMRGPASVPMPTMINSRDLGPDVGKNIVIGPATNIPVMVAPPRVAPLPAPNTYINEVIRGGGKVKTTIIINK